MSMTKRGNIFTYPKNICYGESAKNSEEKRKRTLGRMKDGQTL